MEDRKEEAKTVQQIADHFMRQLHLVQEEARDINKMVLWMSQMAILILVRKINESSGLSLKGEEILRAATDCIDENFEVLKKEDADFHAFRELVEKTFPDMFKKEAEGDADRRS
ncbi:MAG: hypothetical protein PHI60_08900 [Candidatus Omnitrophica bacterium]|nr:hypothetical protein [Candidatus Omnitrophota bacterium]